MTGSVYNLKNYIKSMLQYMEDRPNEFDVNKVHHYKEQLGKCNDVCSTEVLYQYVLALRNDWVTFD